MYVCIYPYIQSPHSKKANISFHLQNDWLFTISPDIPHMMQSFKQAIFKDAKDRRRF